MQYTWDKTNVFARWSPQKLQSMIVIFDACKSITECVSDRFLRSNPSCIGDPFWIYVEITTELVHREEAAVWAIRDQVRSREIETVPRGWPRPDYRRLHDIARHAIHVSETLDVANDTLTRIITEHEIFMASDVAVDKNLSQDIHHRLRFIESMMTSLRQRSVSNEKRLLNEIQLAFHIVAQHDANTSVEIGRAAHSDGAAMKTIAFATLAFLPPTFISAIFSMSFFSFSPDSGWTVSGKIWVYWAFAVPLTLGSFLLWYYYLARTPALARSYKKSPASIPSALPETAVMLQTRQLSS